MEISFDEIKNYLKVDELSVAETILLRELYKSAVVYAEQYQTKDYSTDTMKETTAQAIKMLVSHWYDNRDGNNGSSIRVSDDLIYRTVNRLLYFDRVVHV